MEIFRFVEAFRSLQTRDSRRHALDALVGELTPYEWRALHAVTDARTFQFDIVGQLPLELVAQIFSHLDITHPYRLQLVSRKWHHILRSLTVLKVGLHNWNHDTVDLHNVDYATCYQMAQRIQAFRTGKPNSHFVLHLDRPVMDPILTKDTIIWSSGDFASTHRVDFICVLNLRTWNFRKLQGDARETVCSFVASDDIVALMTYTNTCYVWELHGDELKKFKVPSQDYFNCTTCRGRTVACAAIGIKTTSVYIWEFDSQRGQSFDTETLGKVLNAPASGKFARNFSSQSTEYLSRSTLLLLQPQTSSIIIMTDTKAKVTKRARRPSMKGHIISTQLSYDGACISQSRLLPEQQTTKFSLMVTSRHTPRIAAIGYDGRFAVDVEWTTREHVKDVWMEFDEHQNQFITTSERSWSPSSAIWWNDTCFKPTGRGACYSYEWHAEHETKVENTSGFEMFLRSDYDTRAIPGPTGRRRKCGNQDRLLNDRYLVQSQDETLLVYCFDESNGHPKERGPFFSEGVFTIAVLWRKRADRAETHAESDP